MFKIQFLVFVFFCLHRQIVCAERRHWDANRLPESVALIFDHQVAHFPDVKLDAENPTHAHHVDNAKITHFARAGVKVSVPREEFARKEVCATVTVDGAHENPILLAHDQKFGGDNSIPFEKGNMCEWLIPQTGNTRAANLCIPLGGPPKTRLSRKEPEKTFFFYIGFAGLGSSSVVVDMSLSLTLQDLTHGSNSVVCEKLDEMHSVSDLHMQQLPGSSFWMTARSLPVIDWNSVRSVEAPVNPSSLLSLAVELGPKALDQSQLQETERGLAFRVAPNSKGLTVLLGPFSAASPWQLEKATLLDISPDASGTVLWASIENIVDIMQHTNSLFKPPSLNFVVLVMSLDDNDMTVIVAPALLHARSKTLIRDETAGRRDETAGRRDETAARRQETPKRRQETQALRVIPQRAAGPVESVSKEKVQPSVSAYARTYTRTVSNLLVDLLSVLGVLFVGQSLYKLYLSNKSVRESFAERMPSTSGDPILCEIRDGRGNQESSRLL